MNTRMSINSFNAIQVRNVLPNEFSTVGNLMVDVYSNLDGFPKPDEQPAYYDMLRNVGQFCSKPETELLVALNDNERIVGAVVYFGNMQYYGSGGTATQEADASGFRLLAVSRDSQGQGIGKLLTQACIEKGRARKHRFVVIHSTKAMQTAWQMYEKLGFIRSEDLDFMQGELPVFGFRLDLNT